MRKDFTASTLIPDDQPLEWLPVMCSQALAGSCSSADITRFVLRASTELEQRKHDVVRASLHWEALAATASGDQRNVLEMCIQLRAQEHHQYATALELLKDYAVSHRAVHAELAILAAQSASTARRGWLLELKDLMSMLKVTTQPDIGAA